MQDQFRRAKARESAKRRRTLHCDFLRLAEGRPLPRLLVQSSSASSYQGCHPASPEMGRRHRWPLASVQSPRKSVSRGRRSRFARRRTRHQLPALPISNIRLMRLTLDAQPQSTLAKAAGSNEEALYRVLRLLASHGILEWRLRRADARNYIGT